MYISRFPLYGVFGLLLIILSQLILVTRVQFLQNLYFPLIWLGYITLVDALVFWIKEKSLLMNKRKSFLALFPISIVFWWFFEIVNKMIQNWRYIEIEKYGPLQYFLLSSLIFSVTLPAIIETTDLINALGIFKTYRMRVKRKISTTSLYVIILLGLTSFSIPIFFPVVTFPIMWFALLFILDPINYMRRQPSVMEELKEGDFEIPLSLIFAGVITGLLWEFWNYWSISKWVNAVPFFDFYRIFIEVHPLSYIGFLFFSWQLYAMYHFVKSIPLSEWRDKLPI